MNKHEFHILSSLKKRETSSSLQSARIVRKHEINRKQEINKLIESLV